MDSKEKKLLIEEIKKQLEEIESDILYLKEHSKPVSPENAIGRISRMDAINNMNINKSLLSNKEKLKNDLENVLQNINDKNFGICTRCKKGIPYQRIIRVPEATLCVPCIREMSA